MKIVPFSQLDTTNPGTWPLYYRLPVWIGIIAALVFGYGYFIRTPIIEEQESLQQTIDTKKQDFHKLFQETLDLPKYQQRSAELFAILTEKLNYLPPNDEIANLISSVYDSAVENNMNFSEMNPGLDIKEKYYVIKPFNLKTKTGYINFAKFAERIASLERILNVTDMEIIMKDSSEILDINATLQTYVYSFDLEELKNGKNKGGKK